MLPGHLSVSLFEVQFGNSCHLDRRIYATTLEVPLDVNMATADETVLGPEVEKKTKINMMTI